MYVMFSNYLRRDWNNYRYTRRELQQIYAVAYRDFRNRFFIPESGLSRKFIFFMTYN